MRHRWDQFDLSYMQPPLARTIVDPASRVFLEHDTAFKNFNRIHINQARRRMGDGVPDEEYFYYFQPPLNTTDGDDDWDELEAAMREAKERAGRK